MGWRHRILALCMWVAAHGRILGTCLLVIGGGLFLASFAVIPGGYCGTGGVLRGEVYPNQPCPPLSGPLAISGVLIFCAGAGAFVLWKLWTDAEP